MGVPFFAQKKELSHLNAANLKGNDWPKMRRRLFSATELDDWMHAPAPQPLYQRLAIRVSARAASAPARRQAAGRFASLLAGGRCQDLIGAFMLTFVRRRKQCNTAALWTRGRTRNLRFFELALSSRLT